MTALQSPLPIEPGKPVRSRVPPPWEGAGWDRGEARWGALRTGQQPQACVARSAPLLSSPLLLPPPSQGGGTHGASSSRWLGTVAP